MTVQLLRFDPGKSCPKCEGEFPDVTWHKGATYGAADPWPCSALPGTGEHLCRKCTRCGYAWMEAPADASSYPADTGSADEEGDMTIRKTGSATDQKVTEVENPQFASNGGGAVSPPMHTGSLGAPGPASSDMDDDEPEQGYDRNGQ